MKQVDDFIQFQPFVAGQTLTQEAAIFVNKLVAAVKELQEQSADYEARITVLEP